MGGDYSTFKGAIIHVCTFFFIIKLIISLVYLMGPTEALQVFLKAGGGMYTDICTQHARKRVSVY